MTYNLVFIGGFENTGTRLIIKYLLDNNYTTIKVNSTLDYLGLKFLDLFDEYWKTKNINNLLNQITSDIKNNSNKNIVIKHGHLCFLFPYLKTYFPNAYFILCIRNPLDILIKTSHNYKRYHNLNPHEETIENKLECLKLWYSPIIINKSDIIIRLEDVVYNNTITIQNLFKKLNITNGVINNYIKIPESINKGSKIYKTDTILQFMNKFNYN
jgi:hypothetical protein